MKSVFISYRHSDAPDVTGRIYDHLVRKYRRKRVFKDVDSIAPGMNFSAYIMAAIRQSAVALVIIGPSWLTAHNGAGARRLDDPHDFVRIEIETALREGIAVIPVLVGGARLPAAAQLPPSLQPLLAQNALPVRADPDFHNDIARLIAALDSWMRQPRPRPQTVPLSQAPRPVMIPTPDPQFRDAPAVRSPGAPAPIPMSGDATTAGWMYVVGIVSFPIGLFIQLGLFLSASSSRLLKYHAAQALILGVVGTIMWVVAILVTSLMSVFLTTPPPNLSQLEVNLIAIGAIVLSWLIWLAIVALWVMGMVAGFKGRPSNLPLTGWLARKMAGDPV